MKGLSKTLLTTLTLMPAIGIAFEMPTHYTFSLDAVARSSLSTTIQRLGLRNLSQELPSMPGPSSEDFSDNCARGLRFTIERLIACGAQFEDYPGMRSLNHFFDPTQAGTANDGYLTPLPLTHYSSPRWALESAGQISEQSESYADARQYLFDALTIATSQADRDVAWGKVFQSLGQVIHHIQDMAQPQHVRNDGHCDLPFCALIPNTYHPSGFERRAGVLRARPIMNTWVGAASSVYPQYAQRFAAPRDFWIANGAGLAEFTNTNFVSPRTNFRMENGQALTTVYSSPVPVAQTHESIQALFADESIPQGVMYLCNDQPATCFVDFYSTNVVDGLVGGAPSTNARASSFSVFDQDLENAGATISVEHPFIAGLFYSTTRVFTLNRFNHEANLSYLVPKAVGYSAGLINYFFRGTIQISLPAEGVYGVVDHAAVGATGGFSKLKVKVKNTTPKPGGQAEEVEAMTGSLVAVAKFHPNTCYAADLSREYGAEPQGGCRSPTEEIVVSSAASISGGINTPSGEEVVFTFPTPIPVAATDLFLQVVYRGPLGGEADAIVVETKDISEPTYYPIFDRYEQFNWGPALEAKTWKQVFCDEHSPPLPYEQCKLDNANNYYLRFAPAPATYDPANAVATFQPLVTMANIPVSSYPRVAILTDTVPFHAYLLDMRTGTPSIGQTGPFTPARNQMEFSEQNPGGTLSRVPRYRQVDRPLGQPGVWVEDADYTDLTTTTLYLDYHDIPPITPLTPKPSTINFPPMP